VIHDARIEAQRNELASANSRAQLQRSGYSGPPLPPPDPNSAFMRKMKAATIERAIQAREAEERHANGETARPYNRKKDYYAFLGIDKEASAAEVRRAFRRLSLKYHPDKVAHKSEEARREAAELFAALKEAHEVLGHEATRREYDQMMGVDDLMEDKAFDLADLDGALSRVRERIGRRRPPPTYYEVDVALEELYTGCVKSVEHTRRLGSRSEKM
jgi:DnaJ-domain-containing protein 1